MVPHPLALATALAALAPPAPVSAPAASPTAPAAPARGDLLHRMTLLRAAPGRLLELVAEVKAARARITRRDRQPLLLQHAQGDHWDLMILTPVGSYADHFPKGGAAPPVAPSELVAWQEDGFLRGPSLASFDWSAGAGLYHVEMFIALAGKRADLLKERDMENAYHRALGRPVPAIFVRELGAAWDAFSIVGFRSWKHYAERDDIDSQRTAAAARAAGFEAADRIGPTLRAFISSHHDNLLTPVR